jgi:hypothetical protein
MTKFKVPGIVDIELEKTGKRSQLTMSYKGKSKTVSLYDLYLDELAKVLRELADWLESMMRS